MLLRWLFSRGNKEKSPGEPRGTGVLGRELSIASVFSEPRAAAAELSSEDVEHIVSRSFQRPPPLATPELHTVEGAEKTRRESSLPSAQAASAKGGETAGSAGPEADKKMSTVAMRKAVVVELLLTLVGVAASSAALYFVMRKLDPNAAAAKNAKQKKKEIAKRLGRPMMETNQYEDIIACDVINPENLDVTFSCIGGLHEVKSSLHELIILPLLRPELFQHGKLLRPQKGVLLYGPPGTGKTLLAKAVAKECSAAFINVRVSSLMSKWFGDAQKLVTAVFTLATKLQPCIIFIDEIDSILGQRKSTEHEAITSMKTEFMSLWDGFCTDDKTRVMVLCATNRPWDLDEAILRRLPRSFEIPLPDRDGRANILRVILQDETPRPNVDYLKVADACDGYSGSDLMELCKQAAYYPLRKQLEDEKAIRAETGAPPSERVVVDKRPLATNDFLDALKSSPPARAAAEEYRQRWTGRQNGQGLAPSASSAADIQGLSPEQLLRLMALFMARSAASGNLQNGDAPPGR